MSSGGGEQPRRSGGDLLASQTRVRPADRGTDAPDTHTTDADVREPDVDLREPAELPAREPSPHIDDLLPLVGKVAVVTGGGSVVGRSVASRLLDAGARVCVIGNDREQLQETTAAAGDGPIVYLQCDLGSVTEVGEAADFIGRFDRPVEVLVHAAEVRVPHGVDGGPVADLDEQYLVNLRGPYLLTQQLLGQLRAAPGHVVFLNSAPVVEPGDLQFAMTKAGVVALADGLRDELRGSGVRVTTVHVPDGDLGPDDVADCLLGAVELPRRIELSELHLRANTA